MGRKNEEKEELVYTYSLGGLVSMHCLINWLNTYATAVQAVVAVLSFVLAVLSVILVVVTICVARKANRTAIHNQELLRIHSSPKPFLSIRGILPNPGETADTGHKSILDIDHVIIKNIGPGIAVRVKAYVLAEAGYKLFGQDVITPNENSAIYCFNTDGIPVSLPDNFKIMLEYESDSGFPRTTVWKVSIWYGEVSYVLESSD